MSKQTNYAGFGVAAVLSIVVIVGVLGFVGWRVYVTNKPTQSPTNPVAQSAETKTTETSQSMQQAVVDAGPKISFSYPGDWSFSKTAHQTGRAQGDPSGQYTGETTEDARLTSPDGTIEIFIGSGIDGIGGACIPEEEPTMVQFTSTTLERSQDYSLVSYRGSNNLYVAANVISTADVKNGGEQKSVCGLAFAGFLQNPKGAYTIRILSTDIKSKSTSGQNVSAAEINEFFANPAYKQAQDIITQSMQIQ